MTFKKIARRLGADNADRRHMLSAGAISLATKVGNAALRLLAASAMVRLMSPANYGSYVLIWTWVELAKIPFTQGLPAMVSRNVAHYKAMSDWPHLNGLFLFSGKTMFVLGAAMATLMATIAVTRHEVAGAPATEMYSYLIASVSVLFGASAAFRNSYLRGLGRVNAPQFIETVVAPAAVLLALAGIYYLLGARQLTPAQAACAQLVGAVIALATGAYWLRKHIPVQLFAAPPQQERQRWLREIVPFALTGAVTVLNGQADPIMISWFLGHEDVGLYRIASVIATSVIFVLTATNISLGPTITRFRAQKQHEKLQSLLIYNARLATIMALLIMIILEIFSEKILAIFFGPAYLAAAPLLSILLFGQVLNAAVGSVGVVLAWSGHARQAGVSMIFALLVKVALNVALVPRMGLSGAAWASTLSLVTWNLLMYVQVRKLTNLRTTMFGWL